MYKETIAVRCLRGCVCQGQILEAGQDYEIDRNHAATLIRMGRVEPLEDTPSPPAELTTVTAAALVENAPAPAPALELVPPTDQIPLADLGLGPRVLEALHTAGYTTAEQLADAIAGGLDLQALPGIGPAKADKIIEALEALEQ